ncbi:hypothetical protein DFS34DRAFT_661754 [Phlyctochytrium arcticum]|nr:hypothetical protein DFS34DRAFT_661754 [Phlyctochytrium arcticum]
MVGSECPRGEVMERIPDRWNDLKDNHQRFCVFLHMLGTAKRAMVRYLQWYDCYDMASGKDLDRDTLIPRLDQISLEHALGFENDCTKIGDWAKELGECTCESNKERILAGVDSLRDEVSQKLVVWWADNALLVMARIRAMETTEATASHTHAANDNDTSMQHDVTKHPEGKGSWESEWPELVPQIPVQAGNVTDPSDHDQHLSDQRGQTQQELREILLKERQKDRKESEKLLQQTRDCVQNDMKKHFSHEHGQTRQEMQELLRKEHKQLKLDCDKYMQAEREKDRHVYTKHSQKTRDFMQRDMKHLSNEHGQTRQEIQELLQEERENDRQEYKKHWQRTRDCMQNDMKKLLSNEREEIQELLQEERQNEREEMQELIQEERENDRQEYKKHLQRTRDLMQNDMKKHLCDKRDELQELLQEEREKDRLGYIKHLQQTRDCMQNDMKKCLSHEQGQTRQEIQLLLQKELQGFKLVCVESLHEEHEKHFKQMRDQLQLDRKKLGSNEDEKSQKETQGVLRQDMQEELRKEHDQNRQDMQEQLRKEQEQSLQVMQDLLRKECEGREHDRQPHEKQLNQMRSRLHLLRETFEHEQAQQNMEQELQDQQNEEKERQLVDQDGFEIFKWHDREKEREKKPQERQKHFQKTRDRLKSCIEEF